MSLESCKKCGAQLSTSDMFCSKCGTQRIPENYTPHVKSNRFSKKTKVGMGVAIVIGAFLILAGVSGSLSQQQTGTPSESQQQTGTPSDLIEMAMKSNEPFTGELTELLPTRSDIGTEWEYPTDLAVVHEAGDPSNKVGFIEYFYRGHTKYDGVFLALYIYRFDSHENASKFYNDSVEQSKRKGGYKEWSLLDMPADDCYGKFIEEWITVKATAYCIKNNIVVFSIARGDYENEIVEDAGKFAESVTERVVWLSLR